MQTDVGVVLAIYLCSNECFVSNSTLPFRPVEPIDKYGLHLLTSRMNDKYRVTTPIQGLFAVRGHFGTIDINFFERRCKCVITTCRSWTLRKQPLLNWGVNYRSFSLRENGSLTLKKNKLKIMTKSHMIIALKFIPNQFKKGVTWRQNSIGKSQ